MKKLSNRSTWLCLVVLVGIYTAQPSLVCGAQTGIIYRNAMIPMRDGVGLATDVYVPSDDGVTPARGRRPALLVRTPYGKEAVSKWNNDRVGSGGFVLPQTAND